MGAPLFDFPEGTFVVIPLDPQTASRLVVGPGLLRAVASYQQGDLSSLLLGLAPARARSLRRVRSNLVPSLHVVAWVLLSVLPRDASRFVLADTTWLAALPWNGVPSFGDESPDRARLAALVLLRGPPGFRRREIRQRRFCGKRRLVWPSSSPSPAIRRAHGRERGRSQRALRQDPGLCFPRLTMNACDSGRGFGGLGVCPNASGFPVLEITTSTACGPASRSNPAGGAGHPCQRGAGPCTTAR